MMPTISTASLKDGKWYEYIVRFGLGGLATVVTGTISETFGAAAGGLFLALPAIFCASATLIEKHEVRRKRGAGLKGQTRGRKAAALDAAGAALGSLGMLAFALSFAAIVQSQAAFAFVVAFLVWAAVALIAWLAWRWRPKQKR
jgi:hypothetical protein